MNVVLFSNQLDEIFDEISSCISPNCILIKYDYYNDTFENIISNISNHNELKDAKINNVSIFQESNDTKPNHSFINQSEHIVDNIENEDPELETWTPFIDFVLTLKKRFDIHNLDLLLCKIYSNDNWKYICETIENRVGINIRSSDNNTGHTLFEGDWILESEKDTIDLIGIYFTNSILNVEIILGLIDDTYNMFVNEDGNIFYVGRNNGQMGVGNTTNKSTFTQSSTPTEFETGETFKFVASTGRLFNTMAYTNLGNIYIAGNHSYGVGGDKLNWSKFDSENTEYNNVGDVSFLYGREIVSLVGTNTQCFFALLDNGDLYGYGRNAFGEMLTGNTNEQSQFVKINITNNEKVKKVSAHFEGAVIVLSESNTVYTWGNNQYGRLALGNTQTPKTSIQTPEINIDEDDYVIDVISGTMILTNNGRVFAAGREYKYQFQRNTSASITVNRTSFVEISLSSLNGTEKVSCICVTNKTILLGTTENNIYAAGVDHQYTATNKKTNNGQLKICLFQSGHEMNGNIVTIGSLNNSIYMLTDTGYFYVSGLGTNNQTGLSTNVYKWNLSQYSDSTQTTNITSVMNQSYILTLTNEMKYEFNYSIILDSSGNNALDIFDEDGTYQEVKTKLTNGIYTIYNVPSSSPLAVLNHDESHIKYDGTSKESSNVLGPDGNYYDFYSGTFYIYIDGSFSDGLSLYSTDLSDGYLGTQNKLYYDLELKQYIERLDQSNSNVTNNEDYSEIEITATYDMSGNIVCDISTSETIIYTEKNIHT